MKGVLIYLVTNLFFAGAGRPASPFSPRPVILSPGKIPYS